MQWNKGVARHFLDSAFKNLSNILQSKEESLEKKKNELLNSLRIHDKESIGSIGIHYLGEKEDFERHLIAYLYIKKTLGLIDKSNDNETSQNEINECIYKIIFIANYLNNKYLTVFKNQAIKQFGERQIKAIENGEEHLVGKDLKSKYFQSNINKDTLNEEINRLCNKENIINPLNSTTTNISNLTNSTGLAAISTPTPSQNSSLFASKSSLSFYPISPLSSSQTSQLSSASPSGIEGQFLTQKISKPINVLENEKPHAYADARQALNNMPTSSSPVPHLNLSSSFSPQSVQPQYYPIQSPVPSSGSIPFRQITREQFEQLSPEDKARYVSSYQQLCVQQASWFTWQQQQFQLYPQTNIWGQQNPYASQSPVPMNFAASSSGTNSLSNFDNQAHPPLKGPDRSSLFTEYTGMPHILPTDYKVVHTQQQSGSLNSRNLQEPPSAFYQTHNAVIAASAPPPKLPTQKDNSQTNSSSFKSYHTETIFSSEIMPQPVYHIPEPCFGAQPEKYLEPSHSKPSQPNYQLSPSATTSVSPASPSSSPLPQATASVHLQSSPPNLTQGPPPTDQFKPLFPSTSPFTIEFHKHKDLPKDEKLTQKMIYFWYKISEMFTPDLLGSSFYPSIFQKSKLQTTTSEDSDRTPRRYENIFFNVIKLPRDDIPVNKEDDSI